MDDLIKHLRTMGKDHGDFTLAHDAADVIEDLARTLKCISVWADVPPVDVKQIEKSAREALKRWA